MGKDSEGFHRAISEASYKNMFIEWETIHAHISLYSPRFLLDTPSLQHSFRKCVSGDRLSSVLKRGRSHRSEKAVAVFTHSPERRLRGGFIFAPKPSFP